MTKLVGLYYNENGDLEQIVIPHHDIPGRDVTDSDFAPHDAPQLLRVTIPLPTFELCQPVTVPGIGTVHHDLDKRTLPDLLAKSHARGLALSAKIAERDAVLKRIVDTAAKRKTDIETFLTDLTTSQRAQIQGLHHPFFDRLPKALAKSLSHDQINQYAALSQCSASDAVASS